MLKVWNRGNESAESMCRRLKKMCERDGLLREIRDRAYYEKPSDVARRKRHRALRQSQKFDGTGRVEQNAGKKSKNIKDRRLAERNHRKNNKRSEY